MLPAYAGMILYPIVRAFETARAPSIRGDDPSMNLYTRPAISVLPAYAGMIRKVLLGESLVRGAPRIRGDDPGIFHIRDDFEECSPHTRG